MPQIGEIIKAKDIGRKSYGFVRWVKCPVCGVERWLCYRKYKAKPLPEETRRCQSCRTKQWIQEREFYRENHPNWKGGKNKTGSGYIRIYNPDQTAAKLHHTLYVFEHISVWEKANGKLPEGYLVHHLNGIKNDNRLKNLLALPRRGHSPTLLIKEVQKRLREVEAQLAQQRLL